MLPLPLNISCWSEIDWFPSIWLAGLWVASISGTTIFSLDFPLILLLSGEAGSSSKLSPTYSYLIGQLILNPLLWLVDWQQRRVSVAPLPLVSLLLISSWIRLDRMPVGGKQKPLPVIPISNNVHLVYNGPTPIQVSLMKYRWCSYCNQYGVHMVYVSYSNIHWCVRKWWLLEV